MRYIYFALIILVFFGLVTTGYAQKTDAMIHYSEESLGIGDTYSLEQGYSFKVHDSNGDTGNSWIELYLNGNKIDTDDQFSKKNDPFEYVKTVTENGDEVDHLILRITPLELIESPNKILVKFKIEQYIDPEMGTDDYLLIDRSKSVNNIKPLELENGYTLYASKLIQDSAVLTLEKDGSVVKEKKIDKGDFFTYNRATSNGKSTIFLAELSEIFTSKDYNTAFLEHVTLKKDNISDPDSGLNSNINLNIRVRDLNNNGLDQGDKAIISYTLENSNFSKVQVMLDGDQIDIRRDVNAGTYVTLTGNLTEGVHNTTVVAVYNDGSQVKQTTDFVVGSASEESSMGMNQSDNTSKSANNLKKLAGSVIDRITNNNTVTESSTNVSTDVSGISGNSGLVRALSAVITMIVFSILAYFILSLLR
ncbi:MAG: hypothetical protein ACLFMM_00245 [Methanohalobium sp.]|uniref:hypothetical protein n=1 Tax=Methanohalobium sp. TaxID=2837493 RepID=UPI00397D083F